MAGMTTSRGCQLLRKFFGVTPLLRLGQRVSAPLVHVPVSVVRVRCAATNPGDGGRKVSARLAEMQQILQEAEERALSAGSEPTPKITIGNSDGEELWNKAI